MASAPMFFVAIALVGEVALALLLFSDATRIDLRLLRHEFVLPARLLGIGLPLTVAAGTGMIMLLLPEVSVAEVALMAAILAPTDAALGQEVVSNEAVPGRIRHGLIVESGLNDGLVVPAVAFFLVLANNEEEIGSAGFWDRFVFEQIGVGLVVGVAAGAAGAWLLTRAERFGWAEPVYTQLATLSIVVCAVGALTLGRMVPVAIAMTGMGTSRVTRTFVGWFGPRGLASILFGLLHIEEDLPNADALFGVIVWTVLLSIVLHGATAAWGAAAYGRWWARHPDDHRGRMPEAMTVREQRPR